MKPLVVAIAFLFLPSLARSAPADSVATDSHPNSLRGGAWALQFDVNGELMSFDSFAGGLSLKRQFSPKSALRFGIALDLRGRNAENEATGSRDIERSDDSQYARIETIFHRYVNPTAVVNAYWGVGPIVSYDRSEAESATDSTMASTTRTRWNTGVTAILGTEWFFARQFSLHAEYLAFASYFTETSENTSAVLGVYSTKTKSESDGWAISTADYIRLGLSAYF